MLTGSSNCLTEAVTSFNAVSPGYMVFRFPNSKFSFLWQSHSCLPCLGGVDDPMISYHRTYPSFRGYSKKGYYALTNY